MHGNPIAAGPRAKAGMSAEFIAALAAYVPDPKGRQVPDLSVGQVPAANRAEP